ncbi:holo-ACP synthase [Limosilactobacillus kribbianus]|uniref:holo-ACP synthase n=1 Tax=Limosilactobacillus kribbianus TaxID=2982695 RepID=UPI0022640DB1|nr:holo-ACP synthase [Limosilactobacillus kribbianus]
MIKGIGIDLTEIDRVQAMVSEHPQFVQRLLTPAELKQYRQFSGQRAAEYVAGRWSLKESFSKAWGTGIGAQVGFQDIEIVDNQLGAPTVTKSPFNGIVHASVSHTATLVMTEIILESVDKDD